jgi:hypothetical protein
MAAVALNELLEKRRIIRGRFTKFNKVADEAAKVA